ncbi:MAG TPA: flagellar basal body-associated FliL family protein [Methylocella sp.]|nr:flagellar basal body-associated FliL family protein [Methylocella sp.]
MASDNNANKDMAASPSARSLIMVMVALTLVAGAAGAYIGLHMQSRPTNGPQSLGKCQTGVSTPEDAQEEAFLELPPVITNLAEPSDAWVRVQAAIVFDRTKMSKPNVAASEIGGDILAYMRTLSISQIEGASGLQHVREDLNERAAVRSGGLVRELILHTLVIQ